MSGPVFVDTNVLVYARDATVPKKQAQASEWIAHLWRTRQGRVSTQVLAEFYAVVTRKLTPPVPVALARKEVLDLMAWSPFPLDRKGITAAWACQDDFGLSWWDALIASAAQLAGCSHLLSDDFQEGRTLGGVTVISPFRHSPASLE